MIYCTVCSWPFPLNFLFFPLKLHHALFCFFYYPIYLSFKYCHSGTKESITHENQLNKLCRLQTESTCSGAPNHRFRNRFYLLIIVCWTDCVLVTKLQVLADMINRDVSCCDFRCQAIWMQALLVNSQKCHHNNPRRDRTSATEGQIHMANNQSWHFQHFPWATLDFLLRGDILVWVRFCIH